MQVAVKLLATQGPDAATLQRFKEEGTIRAAQTCSLVCRVLGYCIKEQRLCLVMLRYAGSLVSLVSGTNSIHVNNIHALYSTTDIESQLALPLIVELTHQVK